MTRNFFNAFIDTILACKFTQDWGFVEIAHFTRSVARLIRFGCYDDSSWIASRIRIRTTMSVPRSLSKRGT
ncbi:MAG: hypothetical protein OXL96_21150 [Candidatus Poribacteria bacterium]|nr:hypothetical protein [Candidatus Poribacteria bacterium]